MKKLIFLFLVAPVFVFGQKLKKADKQIVDALKSHIYFLADDKLEGRRAGTPGEALAVKYITAEFTKAGISPKGDSGYAQAFIIDDGKAIKQTSMFQVNGKDMVAGTDFFPMGYSPDSKLIESASAVSVLEKGSPWFINLAEGIIPNKDNPHFDIDNWIRNQIKNSNDKGASAVILYNTIEGSEDLKIQWKG